MLRLEHLHLHQTGFDLHAHWQAKQGQKIALIGPSGAGKSSLLAAIAGFFAPKSGKIFWQDQEITTLPPALRPISILFQDQNLFPHLSLYQNLGLGLRTDLKLDKDDKRRIGEVLERVGLSGLEMRKPAALSGGQASRAGLARALLRKRPILLLDEPFAALGPAHRDEMLSLVRETAQEQNALVVMVTHDPKDALAFADQTVLVADAHAFAPMATADMFDDPPPALRSYLGARR